MNKVWDQLFYLELSLGGVVSFWLYSLFPSIPLKVKVGLGETKWVTRKNFVFYFVFSNDNPVSIRHFQAELSQARISLLH